jgi:5,5'-dehydrodivanillate O-demethylase
MIFPTHLRTRGSIWLRTPIDDTHTLQWTVNFRATADGHDIEQEEIPVRYLDAIKQPADASHPVARYDLQVPWGQPLAQDIAMWETQGPVSDRENERLATSDKGIALLRELMFEEIAKVERGEDPMGVIRDPNQALIDTNLVESISMDYPTGTHTATREASSPRV